jgi:adenylate cyclase
LKFRTRLSLLFGGLLIVSLATVLLSINQIAKSSALKGIEKDLTTTVITVEKLHQQRVLNLQQNLRLLAGDYGFKSAYASEDELTIRSALNNHQNRLVDANLMVLCDLDGLVLSNTYQPSLNSLPFPWLDILDRADESDTGETTAFGVLGGQVYQFIVTPLLAPDIEAWVVSGFRLDKGTAAQFSDVTGSQISFFQGTDKLALVIASTLNQSAQESLVNFLKNTKVNSGLNRYQAGNETHIGYFLALNDSASPQVTAFVQQSLDKALAPYRKLSNYVMWIFIGSIAAVLLLIIVLSKNVTRSLVALSSAARSVKQGDLSTRVEESGNDEFSLLSRTFNEMTLGLAEKEQVRDLLGKVVSPEIASKLISEGVELGGEEREVTVLFCDIRGFTKLSESRPPTEVLNALNAFFSVVSDIIESHGGVVDKYIGDAVMALFGVPVEDRQHAANAVACGIEMCQAADKLVTLLKTNNGKFCDFGVGIHTGTVVAGNVGSATRLNYTVIGDTVNVASRVEGQSRVFNTPLIVTDATASQCPDIDFKKLGSVRLKGRSQQIALLTAEENQS